MSVAPLLLFPSLSSQKPFFTAPHSSPSTVTISEEKRFNFRSKCREKNSVIVEELYLDLEDLKQGKSDREGGGGERKKKK